MLLHGWDKQHGDFLDEAAEVHFHDMKSDIAVVVFTQIRHSVKEFLQYHRTAPHYQQPVPSGLADIGIFEKFVNRSGYQGQRGLDFMEKVGVELHLVFVSLLFLKPELVFHLQFVVLPVAPLYRSLEKIKHP